MKANVVSTPDSPPPHHVYTLTIMWCTVYRLGEKKKGNTGGKKKKKTCRDPGSNQGPLDLQSNALPTELSRLLDVLASINAIGYSAHVYCVHSVITCHVLLIDSYALSF